MKLATELLLAVVVVIMLTAVSSAQYFRDDFDDGSATDGVPVTWILSPPYVGGTTEVQDASYVLTPDDISDYADPYSEIDVAAEGISLAEVSLRSTVRLLGPETNDFFLGLFGRSTTDENGDQNGGIWAAIRPSGRMTLGIYNGDQNVDRTWQGRYDFTTSVESQDVNLQLDIFADRVGFFAWEVGRPRPNDPQIIVADLPNFAPSEGEIGLFTVQGLSGPMAPVAFRYFEAAPVPEPATVGLAGIGVILMASSFRPRKLGRGPIADVRRPINSEGLCHVAPPCPLDAR